MLGVCGLIPAVGPVLTGALWVTGLLGGKLGLDLDNLGRLCGDAITTLTGVKGISGAKL